MTCYICTNISQKKLFNCPCGNNIHIQYLHKANILSAHWSNDNRPKYVLEIFDSPNFNFNCLSCGKTNASNLNKSDNYHSPNLSDINNNIMINTKLINVINSKVSEIIYNQPT